MKRVCSPLPWKAIFSRTSSRRPLKSNSAIAWISGSTRNAHSSRGMEKVPMLMSGAWSCGVGPVATVVIAVDIDHQKARMPRHDAIEQCCQRAVIFGVDGERALAQRGVAGAAVPDLQAPGLL